MATLRAYLAHSYRKPHELAKMSDEQLADELTFSTSDMRDVEGWIEVGSAHVSVTLHDMESMLKNAVDSLQQQAQTIRAEAELKAGRLEEEARRLLAITFDTEAA